MDLIGPEKKTARGTLHPGNKRSVQQNDEVHFVSKYYTCYGYRFVLGVLVLCVQRHLETPD